MPYRSCNSELWKEYARFSNWYQEAGECCRDSQGSKNPGDDQFSAGNLVSDLTQKVCVEICKEIDRLIIAGSLRYVFANPRIFIPGYVIVEILKRLVGSFTCVWHKVTFDSLVL